MQETWVLSLGWEDPLEKEIATHSSVLAWRIPRTEDPGRYSPWGRREFDETKRLSLHFARVLVWLYVFRVEIRRVAVFAWRSCSLL